MDYIIYPCYWHGCMDANVGVSVGQTEISQLLDVFPLHFVLTFLNPTDFGDV